MEPPEPPVPRRLAAGLGLALLLIFGAVAVPDASLRWSRLALLNVGPNDVDYVRGFRSEWERDVRTRFRWTSMAANVSLPVHVGGTGHLLRMRLRRHFVDPARVSLSVEGRVVAVFDVQADTLVPYRIVEVPLPPLEGRYPFVLSIEAPSANPRPLGFALDWLEVVRQGPSARFRPVASMRWRLAVAVAVAFLTPWLAGTSRTIATGHALVVLAAAAAGTAWDVVAAERILREGLPVYVGVALLAAALVRFSRLQSLLSLPGTRTAGKLVLILLVALAVRLVLMLHPQFYYPDVKVHALFAWELARRGLSTFLRDFTLNQYRYSLGLQLENGHWYAFPYPPAFYILAWPLVRLAEYRAEVAVSVLAAAVNSLEALLVFGIARRLRAGPGLSLAAAGVHGVLPLFIARLTLGYFPALVGHAVDAAVILYLLSHLDDLRRPRVVLTLAGLLALAFLAYTQALLNFGVLLLLFVIVQFAWDRTPGLWSRAGGVVLAGAVALLIALAAFYGRYLPIFLDMRRGTPMPEERVLLERMERARSEEVTAEEPDPFTGSDVNLVRGVRKAGWRLYVFYGPFALAVLAGVLLLVRDLGGTELRWVVAWAATYLVLNLASGGLPGPNLVRYNKDLEVVAPLCCLAVARAGAWLWGRSSLLGVSYGVAYLLFAVVRAARYLTDTFVLER